MAIQTTHTRTASVGHPIDKSIGTRLPPVPVVDTIPTGPTAWLAQQRMRDLLASARDIPSLNPLAGITSGPGNQGSSNTAHMSGHAGTGASQIALPRQLKIGQSGTKPQ